MVERVDEGLQFSQSLIRRQLQVFSKKGAIDVLLEGLDDGIGRERYSNDRVIRAGHAPTVALRSANDRTRHEMNPIARRCDPRGCATHLVIRVWRSLSSAASVE